MKKMKTFLKPTSKQGSDFYNKLQGKKEFTMLNLLKFNKIAKYGDDADYESSGEEAYQLYLKKVQPELTRMGSVILFQGKPTGFLIGPEDEKWDFLIIIKHTSVEKFLKFSQSEVYLRNVKHQKAALQDFRLLPIL